MNPWSADLTTLIETANVIERSFIFQARNGYQHDENEDWTEIGVISHNENFEIGNPSTGNITVTVGVSSFKYLNEFDRTNPVQQFAECRIILRVTLLSGASEEHYIFWGFIRSIKIEDFDLMIEASDWMEKLDRAHAIVSLESLIDGPYEEVRLRHDTSGIWDDAGEEYTFEIDPTFGCPGLICQDWAEDIFGGNRSWVQGQFIVEKLDGSDWIEIPASEYFIDTVLGLVRFNNDQIGETFRLAEVSVYIEGTLEVADALEQIFVAGATCPTLGMGMGAAELTINLTGTVTFDVGDSYLVTGSGTAFLTELETGDRIALHSEPLQSMAIVEAVIDDTNLTLIYPYDQIGGTPGASGAAFASTLKTSGLQLTNIRWAKCDGTAADLYRHLQEKYADARGYRLWVDYANQRILGDQVRIKQPGDPRIIEAAPVLKNGIRILGLTEDFGSAVTVTGQVGRGRNLITDSITTITDLALLLAPEFGHVWQLGPATGGAPTAIDGVQYAITTNALRDLDFNVAYAVFHPYDNFPDREVAIETYYDFLKIDLGDIYELSQIHLYRIPARSQRKDETMGVDILGSIDDASYTSLTPETYHYEMKDNEAKNFEVQDQSSPVRYLKIRCRPLYWVNSGKELTMGFREIQIFGTQRVCVTACIQGEIAHGERYAGTGTVTFQAGKLVDGAGTNFGGVGEPDVGDYIARSDAPNFWAIIEAVNAPSGVGCVELRYTYPGTIPSSGPLIWANGTAPYAEGEGGHFIGGNDIAGNFIRNYYPDLVKKMSAYGHRMVFDDSGLVVTELQAVDRAYIILNEVIRLYRQVAITVAFDPRIGLFDTIHAIDDYRLTGGEDIYMLVERIQIGESTMTFIGTEYGAGVLS